MPNIRVLEDNAIDRSTLTAAATAGAMAASNLLLESKSSQYRSTTTSATLTATWANLETVSCLAALFSNLSPTATVRVQGYSDTTGTTRTYDSGTVLFCPAPAIVPRGWTAAAAASAYAYGGGTHGRIWIPSMQVRRLQIDIVDTNNLQGYVEISRLLAGAYFSPTINFELGGFGMSRPDTSRVACTDAGDPIFDGGYRSHRVRFSLATMAPADRTALSNIFARSGTRYPVLVSLFPGNADTSLDRDHMVYGTLPPDVEATMSLLDAYSASVEVKSI